jgi:hypothetical protein
MLKIMIVSAKVGMDFLLLKETVPLIDERFGITMVAIGVERMMSDDEREWGAWLVEFSL